MLRFPYLDISGSDGSNLVDRLQADFIGVQITDLEGGESDEALIRLRRSRPYRLPPPKDAPFKVTVGWTKAGALMTGEYRFQRVIYAGDPESGEEMSLVCRAVDDTDALKRFDSEHFDAENGHQTYGDVLRTLAGRAGLGAAIDPEIAKIPLPGGYLLRWKQSVIGLAADIGDELGAIVKPQAGQLTVRLRGSFKTPSGDSLPGVTIQRDPEYAYQADIDGLFGFGSVTTDWFDSSKGRPTEVLKSLSGGLARFALPHLSGSKAYAEAASSAAAQRLQAETATATFECLGNALAVAGAPVRPQGFGPDIDGVNWMAVSVFHDIGPERGWVTTIDCVNAG